MNRNTVVLLFVLGVSLWGGEASGKVVSLSPAMTELVCQLGQRDLLAARSSACDYPPEIRKLPVAGDFAQPNLEKILSLKPALVLSNDLIAPSVASRLESMGIRTIVAPCHTLEEYRKCVRSVAEALGCPDAGQREIDRTISLLKRCETFRRNPLKVLVLIWDNPLYLAGNRTFPNEILRLAGYDTPDFKGNNGYFSPTLEWLLACRADLVLAFQECNVIKSNRTLGQMPCVRKGRVISVKGTPCEDWLQRPGPRWFEAVQFLRERIESP